MVSGMQRTRGNTGDGGIVPRRIVAGRKRLVIFGEPGPGEAYVRFLAWNRQLSSANGIRVGRRSSFEGWRHDVAA